MAVVPACLEVELPGGGRQGAWSMVWGSSLAGLVLDLSPRTPENLGGARVVASFS